MTIRAATPYLILHGRVRDAIEFYAGALGAKVEALLTFGELNKATGPRKDDVMHCVLNVGSTILMLSDGPMDGELPPTGLVAVALDFDDREELDRVFAALAKDGRVIEAVFDAPWGARFGVVHDRFGAAWMLNCMQA